MTAKSLNLSLKEWRAIRNKLSFEMRRWQVPSWPALKAVSDGYPGCVTWEPIATVEDDGASILLRLDAEAVEQLSAVARYLSQDGREMIDIPFASFVADREDCWATRFYLSDFRRRKTWA